LTATVSRSTTVILILHGPQRREEVVDVVDHPLALLWQQLPQPVRTVMV
jgi:hypothetical protein